MAICFTEPVLLPMKFLHCGNKDFRLFAPVTLIHDGPMTFVHQPDQYSHEIYRMCENELRTSKLSKVIVLGL